MIFDVEVTDYGIPQFKQHFNIVSYESLKALYATSVFHKHHEEPCTCAAYNTLLERRKGKGKHALEIVQTLVYIGEVMDEIENNASPENGEVKIEVVKKCTISDCPRPMEVEAGFCGYHAHDKDRQMFHVHNKLTEEQQKRYQELFVRTKNDILARDMSDEQLQEWIHGLEESLVELIFTKKTEIIVAREIFTERVQKLTKEEKEALKKKSKEYKSPPKAKTEKEKKADPKIQIELVVNELRKDHPKISLADCKLIAQFHVKQKIDLQKAIEMVTCADML